MPLIGTRPIPWKLLIAWSIGVGVLTNVVVLAFDADNYNASVLIGSAIGGIGYLGIGAILASRTAWRPPQFGRNAQQARIEQAARRAEAKAARNPGKTVHAKAAPVRQNRPAPTSRTNLTNRRTPPRHK